MRYIYILLLLLFSKYCLLGQKKEDLIKYKEISTLQNKKDSFEIAFKYCKLPCLHKQIQKLDQKLAKEIQQNMKLMARVDSILALAYHTGDSLYEFDQFDLAFPLLSHIMNLYDAHVSVKSIDYKMVTGDLAMIYTKSDKRKNQDSAVYYFNKSIDFGNQDFDKYRLLISGFYPESRTFGMSLLDKMNKILFNDSRDSLYTLKTVLRLMYLCDQMPRQFNYADQKGFLPYSYILISDSLNKHLLGYLIDNKLIPKFSDLGFENAYIELILLHSVLDGDLAFFEKYFTIYVSNMDWGLKSYMFLIDSYLNRIRHTQCYGTVKDRLPNGKFDFVPIENSDTIRRILSEKLNINPKYIQNFK